MYCLSAGIFVCCFYVWGAVMSELWEVAVYFGNFFKYLAPGIIVVLILLALACYGFQMVRLFFKF